MLVEKDKIRKIIKEHKITSFQNKDEEELIDILYETFNEADKVQSEKLATKEDIKMVLEMMDKRFEAVDKRFEDMNKRFSMMFTFMTIGFAILVLLTVIFKFIS
ncbi:MAG: hypothetical protein ACLFM7_08365 [Bacteroidales bacterium]